LEEHVACISRVYCLTYPSTLKMEATWFKYFFNIFIIYFNCKWGFTRWPWYYSKTQHTNNTTIKRNTAHKTTHTINTLHRMKINQSQTSVNFCPTRWKSSLSIIVYASAAMALSRARISVEQCLYIMWSHSRVLQLLLSGRWSLCSFPILVHQRNFTSNPRFRPYSSRPVHMPNPGTKLHPFKRPENFTVIPCVPPVVIFIL
jgi:hypothetical protein